MKNLLHTYCPLIMLLLCITQYAQAQDVEKLKDAKLVKVNGGVSLNTTMYDAIGVTNQRDPFYWQATANLNLNFLDIISAPFSVSISQQNKNFSQPQPFNRFGISPTYKWITAHIGHRSMRFSDFTLAGNLFLGGGVELKPKNSIFEFSAMYGRFAKAVERSNQIGLVFANPTYKRMGFGTKIKVGSDQNNAALSIFRAKDDPNSIFGDTLSTLAPEENLVFGLTTVQRINNRLKFEGEYAYSMLTRDTRSSGIEEVKFSFANNLGGLFKPNSSSQFNKAISLRGSYGLGIADLNLSYRRIDPNYRTLGSSFLSNDLEDISAGVTWAMLKNKVNMSTSGGVQRNNLDESQNTSVKRLIWSVNTGINPAEKTNITLAYSNFNSSTKQVQVQDILTDSLEFFQVTKNGNIGIRQGLNSGNNSSVFLNGSVQHATDNQGSGSNFQNLSLGYQATFFENLSLSPSINMNNSKSSAMTTFTLGPSITASRPTFKGKGRSNLSLGALNVYLNGEGESSVFNLRLNNSITAFEKHNFSSNFSYQKRARKNTEELPSKEFRLGITYNYSF